MNGYSEDLLRRIVSTVGGGISKTQVARTFDVSLSSVKRYVKLALPVELFPCGQPAWAPIVEGTMELKF
jgi:hypothetical protein